MSAQPKQLATRRDSGIARISAQDEERQWALKRLSASRTPVTLFRAGERVVATLVPPSDRDEELRWELYGPAVSGTLDLILAGPTGCFEARVQSFGEASGCLRTSIPTAFFPIRFRSDRRVEAPARSMVHVTLAQRAVACPLLTMSDGGVSFLCEGSAAIQLGTTFDAAVSFISDRTVRLTVNVRHVSESSFDALRVARASVEFASARDRLEWNVELDAIRHPHSQRGEGSITELWELLETSGYLSLSNKQPSDFESERVAFAEASRFLAARPELGAQILYHSETMLESSISAIVEFPGTAALYHMAKRPGGDQRGVDGKSVLRATYEHIISWVARTHVDWLSVWVQDVTRFACGAHRDFAAHRAHGPRAAVFSFWALEISTRSALAAPPGYETRLATAHEITLVLARLTQHFPPCMVDARAWKTLSPDAPSLEGHCIPRQRAVVVTLRAGQLCAAAIFENIMPGIHLFGIFDTVHTVRFDDLQDDGVAVSALLAFAVRWYGELGKHHFVYASEQPASRIPYAKDLGLTHDTVVGAEFLPEFLEHIWQLTAPRN